MLHARANNTEEAFWLVFLSVHFGKHARWGWQYVRSVYGKLGKGRWDWKAVSTNPSGFRRWLRSHEDAIRTAGGGFGNHRKYESLKDSAARGTGAVVVSYTEWVMRAGSHRRLVEKAFTECAGNPGCAFDNLYQGMGAVLGFGRTARFDYLTMIGKIGLSTVKPGSAYLVGATGPLLGARLLFASDERPRDLDQRLMRLDEFLEVGMQVLEDSLCNWQKSPRRFVPFRG